MSYLNNGSWFAKITLPDGRQRAVACGTPDKETAKAVQQMLDLLRRRRQWTALTAIVDKRTTLPLVFDAHERGELPQFLKLLDDPDVSRMVAEWAKHARPKYVLQVRRWLPEGERFPLSNFRRRTIARFLSDLDVAGPTKNRYKAAISSFANWLVDREYLESNPTIRLRVGEEHDPRVLWMPWDEAEAVCDAPSDVRYRALLRLCYGAGVEISAALRTKASDVTHPTIRARGTKTVSRDRAVQLWPWAAPLVFDYARSFIGDALLFDGIKYMDAYRVHRKALGKKLEQGFTLHDARHTYAVNALKAGLRAEVVAHQLGHVNATMVRKVYGRYVPNAADYEVKATPKATRRAKER